MDRRKFLQTSGAALLAAAFGRSATAAPTASDEAILARLRTLESESAGRLGVTALDTRDGRRVSLRGDERFPLCSTFKFLLAAAILHEVEAGRVELARQLPVTKADLIPWAPFTEKRVGGQASVVELCEAAMTLSDNPAANLLLPLVGGPAGLTKYLRELGDPTTRLDRKEPELNDSGPGDPRDTTAPDALVATMQKLLLGDALRESSRTQLTAWLVANKTGDARLRAGLPKDAKVGDKTGSSKTSTNDLAIVWPAGRAPILIACYLAESKLEGRKREEIQAGVARALFEVWAA